VALLASMANILSDAKKQQVIALGQLGWTLRRIEQAIGVRRETVGAYLKASGLVVRPPGRWGHTPNPAKGVSTDSGSLPPGITGPLTWPAPGRAPAASACEPYRELIELALARGRDAMAIYRDLVDDRGFVAKYASVRRFVLKLRGHHPAEPHPVIATGVDEEGQVDYTQGPMVQHPVTRKYRRTRLFVFTLGYSRKCPLADFHLDHAPLGRTARGSLSAAGRFRRWVPKSITCVYILQGGFMNPAGIGGRLKPMRSSAVVRL
jgi:hypothetical protein